MPQFIAPLLVPVFGAGAGFAANVIVGAGLFALQTGAQLLFAPDEPDAPRSQSVNTRPDSQRRPEMRGYGEYLVDNIPPFFWAAKQPEGKGRVLYYGLIIGSETINAIKEFRLYGEPIALDDDQRLVTSPRFIVGGRKTVEVEARLGYVDDAVSAILKRDFPDHWTNDHIAPGMPYVVLAFEKPSNPQVFSDMFQSRQPNVSLLVEGALVFDPRDEDQDITDNSTYAFSKNNALAVLDFMRSYRGQSISNSIIDVDSFIAAADHCDLIKDGVEDVASPQFQINGQYAVNQAPGDTLAAMTASFGADLQWNSQGKIVCEFGAPDETPFVIKDEWIISRSFAREIPIYRRYNAIDVFFKDPDADYVQDVAGILQNQDLVDASNSVVRKAKEPFFNEYVTNQSQAVRLAWKQMHLMNPPQEGTLVLNHQAMGVLYQDNGISRRRLIEIPNNIDGTTQTALVKKVAMQFSTGGDDGEAQCIFTVEWQSYQPEAYTPDFTGLETVTTPTRLTENDGEPVQAANFEHAVYTEETEADPEADPPVVASTDKVNFVVSWDRVTKDVATTAIRWKKVGETDWIDVQGTKKYASSMFIEDAHDANGTGDYLAADDQVTVEVNRFSSDGYESGFASHTFTIQNTTFTPGALASFTATGGEGDFTTVIEQNASPAAYGVQVSEDALTAGTEITSLGAGETYTDIFPVEGSVTTISIPDDGFGGGGTVTTTTGYGDKTISARPVYVDGSFGATTTQDVTVSYPTEPDDSGGSIFDSPTGTLTPGSDAQGSVDDYTGDSSQGGGFGSFDPGNTDTGGLF